MTRAECRVLCEGGSASRRGDVGPCVVCGEPGSYRLGFRMRVTGGRRRGTKVVFCEEHGQVVAVAGGRGLEFVAGGGAVGDVAALRSKGLGDSG
jgi:hypothetical protein